MQIAAHSPTFPKLAVSSNHWAWRCMSMRRPNLQQLSQLPSGAPARCAVPNQSSWRMLFSTSPQQQETKPALPANAKAKARQIERDFFLSVLGASTTKRDAKSYLSRFSPDATGKPPGVRISSPVRGTAPSPVSNEIIHIALVKIRCPERLDNVVLEGLVQTFSQLDRLGLRCVIVLDCKDDQNGNRHGFVNIQEVATEQAAQLESALQRSSSLSSMRMDSMLSVQHAKYETVSENPAIGQVEVQYSDLLLESLRRGVIPVFIPIAYTAETQRQVFVDADEVLLGLTREFAGLNLSKRLPKIAHHDNSNQTSATSVSDMSVDRVILLDPLGGLPSAARTGKSHIFVNMQQEYKSIRHELQSGAPIFGALDSNLAPLKAESSILSDPSSIKIDAGRIPIQESNALKQHIANLDLLKGTLALLPPSSSALLTTPREAGMIVPPPDSISTELGVGTRRIVNPLIYNLLTDKPLVSPSLPAGRLTSEDEQPRNTKAQPSPATFVKHGMPLTMIPDPLTEPWVPPRPGTKPLDLRESRVDFARLLNLIEDSFNRPLDVQDYLKRIQNRIAGIIVAGEYEGGAVLTWELPPGVEDDGSEASRARMVPYLDKFAVLKRSQGTGGVADIVFTAMVRTCFPQGVCWRSRKDNPVNKWYFERATGTRKLPDSKWTMFWTDQGLYEDERKFRDYEAVCRNIRPSWADDKPPD